MFLRNSVVSPDIITGLHPMLVRKEDYTKEIQAILSSLLTPNNNICKMWMKENSKEEEEECTPVL
eukprot:3909759-Ditylum_brightwellii.AAC.1